MNQAIAQQVVEELIRKGVHEFCLAPASRNAPLIFALTRTKQAKVFYWSEERSAAFFALGRIKATNKPVAVVTTSGTAAAELLPAAMSAFYLGLPLLLITADRPRRYRGTGAPQSAEQVRLFGSYVHYEQDLAKEEECDLSHWTGKGPAHLNICFEEPNEKECLAIKIKENIDSAWLPESIEFLGSDIENLKKFLERSHFPLVVVGGLSAGSCQAVIQFLLKLKAPVYAEGPSLIREDERLEPFRITRMDFIWKVSEKSGYPIDGILRIGEIPTARLWRDLEEKEYKVEICSVSEQPFSGLSWADVIHTDLARFFSRVLTLECNKTYPFQNWLKADCLYREQILNLFLELPHAEPSLFYEMSKNIPQDSLIYLGNSLPIREWDLASLYKKKGFSIQASRGVNGIDGQISTFLGLCCQKRSNWAILGDLTALYDMAAPWILSQLQEMDINLVIVNNGGGQIFSRMYPSEKAFTNPHNLSFEHLASFWNMEYLLWKEIPTNYSFSPGFRLIELIPDPEETDVFWKKLAQL